LKVAILANDRASYIRPTADGLARMLTRCGAEPEVFYKGHHLLALRQSVDASSLRSLAGSAYDLIPVRRAFDDFVQRLAGVDLIVVVAAVPLNFSSSALPNIEALRARLPAIPIVNYDLHYLPTLDSWSRFLLRHEKTKLADYHLKIFAKGSFGLERFDWYLTVAPTTNISLAPDRHPISVIGLDIDDGSLYPDQQGRFTALVDFVQPRDDYLGERKIQLEALRLAGVDHVTLEGEYSMEAIRAIYRGTGLYFLSACESFGLPICELQACGSQVFMPSAFWASPHWLGNDHYAPREPVFSPNFVVYERDPVQLADRIRAAAESFDPSRVLETFREYQPDLLHGDSAALADFLDRMESGAIHARLHSSHANVGRQRGHVTEPGAGTGVAVG
jgi:hypothetical protein